MGVGFILLILTGALVALAIYAAVMLVRNEWVFRQRNMLINRFYDTPRALRKTDNFDDDYLTYNEMMRRFWVWDIEKLRKQP